MKARTALLWVSLLALAFLVASSPLEGGVQVELEGEQVTLRSTPFNGFFKDKTAGAAPLKAVFCIAHGKEHRLVDMTKAEAVRSVFHQIVPPMGLHEELSAAFLGVMLDAAERLAERVPVQGLEFRPDGGFWELIDREYH